MILNQRQAVQLLQTLHPSDWRTYVEMYAEEIRSRRKYRARSWLQAVHWIAAGGNPEAVRRAIEKAEK